MKLSLDKIERIMVRKGLRRSDVFGMTGDGFVSHGVFTRLKTGANVSLMTATKLCNLLGCDIDEIVLDKEVPMK